MRAASRASASSLACGIALVLLLMGVLIASAPIPASAAGDEPDPALAIEGPERIEMGRIDIVALPVQTTPDTIVVGVPCGMLEMCGQDPCLCGAVDEWGACACNGRQDASPSFSLECDGPNVAGVFELFGTTYLVALDSGEADASIAAELAHHESAELACRIAVAPFGFVDVLKLLAAFIAAAAVCAALFFAVRALARAARRATGRLRSRTGKRAERLDG